MIARLLLLPLSLAFGAGLAYVVGERLSDETLAIVLGVVAGVVASVPTSLLVVSLATRAAADRIAWSVEIPPAAGRAPEAAEPPEPQIVVVAQPQPAPVYQHYAGYSPAGYSPALAPAGYGPAYAAEPAPSLAGRQFTVIGGAELAYAGEVGAESWQWQR